MVLNKFPVVKMLLISFNIYVINFLLRANTDIDITLLAIIAKYCFSIKE